MRAARDFDRLAFRRGVGTKLTAIGAFQRKPAFVQCTVMMPAELYEVTDTGVAAVRPVHDVMGIDKTIPRTAGKSATAIAHL